MVASVNQVGVDVNAASIELLSRVSGLGPKLEEAVVRYRNEHAPFRSRQDLLQVPRLGPKAFEQAAGELMENEKLLSGMKLENYMNQNEGVGASILQDTLSEQFRPRRDPRREFEAFSFAP